MVELFTVGRLIRSPRLSAPVWSVARLTAPHVSTVERTRHDSKPMSPRDGIRQSIATPASFRTAQSPLRRFRHRTTEHVRLARIQNEKNKSRFMPGARSVSDREFALVGSQQSHHRTVSLCHHDKRTAGAASCIPSGGSNRVKGSQPLL